MATLAAVRAPRRDRPHLPTGYITSAAKGMQSWTAVDALLRDALYFWISTTDADGRPHLIQQWGVWIDQTKGNVFSVRPGKIFAFDVKRFSTSATRFTFGG